jgi:hypothetical protein
VDVTTEEPTAARFSGNNVARALITRSTDSTGKFNPSGENAGGVAYINVFGQTDFASNFSPAFAYYDKVSSSPANIAEVISHEIGHNMGLSHDGTTTVGSTAGVEYYGGHGSGETSWAPIMGDSYDRTVTQWSKGEYANANNQQDDLDIIAKKLADIADDHSGSTNLATTIPADGTTFTGIIGRNADSDVFRITNSANELTISVQPFVSSTTPKHANLDIMVELLNNFGNILAAINPSALLAADSTNNCAPGVYYLRVSGTGLLTPATGYSSYGCLGSYTIKVKETGTPTPMPLPIIGWGRNNEGQCTIPTITDKIQQVAAGFSHSVALRTNGTVIAWGNNSTGQTNVPSNATNIIQIAAGAYHSLALRANGTVIAWGNNSSGQTSVPLNATNIIQIAAGAYHSVALRANGTVIAWGQNLSRQTSIPPGLNGVKEIASGHYHTLALNTNGTVRAWGNNTTRQCNIPAGLTNVVMVAGGLGHSIALKEDSTVVAWGQNNAGQSSVPRGLTNVIQVSAGAYHSVALKEDGTIVTWGNNSFGQLIRNQKNPIESIGAGHFHTLGSW